MKRLLSGVAAAALISLAAVAWAHAPMSPSTVPSPPAAPDRRPGRRTAPAPAAPPRRRRPPAAAACRLLWPTRPRRSGRNEPAGGR